MTVLYWIDGRRKVLGWDQARIFSNLDNLYPGLQIPSAWCCHFQCMEEVTHIIFVEY